MIFLKIAVLLNGVYSVRSLRGPSYTSDWKQIESNDIALSQAIFRHNLGVLPVKVDVQVQALDGPNDGFVFPGTGSAQEDDDYTDDRGGVIYMYNQNEVHVFAPVPGNDGNGGYSIHTGRENSWIGPNYQTSVQAKVRVRVWTNDDFPEPYFVSTPLQMGINDDTYLEVYHGLGAYPAYVNVQVTMVSGVYQNWIAEGTGVAMTGSQVSSYPNVAGVLFGYDEHTVRLWTPVFSHNGIYYGFVFNLDDGWGGVEAATGSVKVRVWRTLNSIQLMNNHIAIGPDTVQGYELYLQQLASRSLQDHFVTVEVEAVDGINSGYRFHGTGFAQDDVYYRGTYGGVIYGYSSDTIRFWRPAIGTGGYIVHVGGMWGNGSNTQASVEGKVVVKAWYTHANDCSPEHVKSVDRVKDYALVMRNTRLSAGAFKEFSVDEMQCSSVCTRHGDCECFTTGGGICRLCSSTTTLETFETEVAEGTMMWLSHCRNTT